jgi:hypothetical protein
LTVEYCTVLCSRDEDSGDETVLSRSNAELAVVQSSESAGIHKGYEK